MNCWDGPFKQHNSIILIVLMLNRYADLGTVCCVSQKSHPVPSWTWIIEVVLCALIHLKCSLISLSPETNLSGKRRHCFYINEKLFAASQLDSVKNGYTTQHYTVLQLFITSTTTDIHVCTHFDHEYFSVYSFWYSKKFLDFALIYDNENNTSQMYLVMHFMALVTFFFFFF